MTDNPESFIPEDIKVATPEVRRTWLHAAVSKVVDRYVKIHDVTKAAESVREASAAQTSNKKFPCRKVGCPKVYNFSKGREDHERKKHNLVLPRSSTVEKTTVSEGDHKHEHTVARLSFSFLLLDMLDAVKEGDGERLMRIYKVALLFYKKYGHSHYAYSTFLLTVQLNATLSPRMAHSVTWNRFWNTRGGKGRNIPLDLHLEHLNGFLKSFLKGLGPNLNESSVARISQSIGVLKEIMEHTDEELGVGKRTGAHHINMDKDILALVDIVQEAQLFKVQAGREYTAFPGFEKSLLAKMDYTQLWNWMNARLKDWRKVPV